MSALFQQGNFMFYGTFWPQNSIFQKHAKSWKVEVGDISFMVLDCFDIGVPYVDFDTCGL
jgi:hypothetical protein